jgi:hypothetical protein
MPCDLDSPVMSSPPDPAAALPSGAGRYAPSPSGDLHLGNLRTAVLAWALARRTDRAFHLRIEDLDRVQEGAAERQLEDLAALGLDWDGEVVHQSARGADTRRPAPTPAPAATSPPPRGRRVGRGCGSCAGSRRCGSAPR